MAEPDLTQTVPDLSLDEYTDPVVCTDDSAVCFVIVWFFASAMLCMILAGIASSCGIVNVQERPSPQLSLIGVPGDTIRLKIYGGYSEGGAWSTHDGFYLTLFNDEVDYADVLTILHPGSGDDGCSGSDCRNRFSVKGSFVVPTLPGGETPTLSGTLSGDIQ